MPLAPLLGWFMMAIAMVDNRPMLIVSSHRYESRQICEADIQQKYMAATSATKGELWIPINSRQKPAEGVLLWCSALGNET